MRRSGPVTIAFMGRFNSTNFGNESSLQAVMHHLRQLYPGANFICITDDPENAGKADDVEAIPVHQELFKFWPTRTSLGRWVRRAILGVPAELHRCVSGMMVLRRADMLIVPGTGLLTDVFGLKGWGPYGLFRWAVIAKLCGCRLLFLSIGAGPLGRKLGRLFAKAALSLADFRSYREISSRQYLMSIGFKVDRDPVYPDLAFGLPAPAFRPSKNKVQEVGLGVMTYAGSYSVPNPSASTDPEYWEKMKEFARWLVSKGYNVRPVTGDKSDASARDRFVQSLRGGAQGRTEGAIIDEPIASVEDLLSALVVSDFVVATRFHNLLLAFLCGKPVIAISFHHKCASLMAAMGMSEYCLDIHDLDLETLIRTFERLVANAEDLTAQIAQKLPEFRSELDDQYRRAFGSPAGVAALQDATALQTG